MKKQKRLWCLCVFLALSIVLPYSGFGERRPLLNLIEAADGEGKRYLIAEEGRILRGVVLEGKRIGLREDTTDIWLAEIPDETLHVELKEGIWKMTLSVNVIVEAEVTFDSEKGDYRYHYTLHNSKTSPREATDFEVVFDRDLSVYDFANVWRSEGWVKEHNRKSWELTGRPALGFWRGILRRDESVEGFSYRSRVLPGIVDCWSLVVTPHSGGFFLKGRTLGPVVPSTKFNPDQFLEQLTFMINESLKEGWIEAESLAEDLKKGLESARQAYWSGDNKRLESILRALVKKVEEEKDGSLLSEAYALLKYNVQYWLDQLK